MPLWLKRAADRLDARDALGLIGVLCLGYGLERIWPGAGFAAVGAVLVYVAVR